MQAENYPDSDNPRFSMTDAARLSSEHVDLFGVSPSDIFEFNKYVDYRNNSIGGALFDQLYTARGSQGAAALQSEVDATSTFA